MFELDLAENKGVLQNLLDVSNQWYFSNSNVCALHKSKYVFVSINIKKGDKDSSLNSMDELKQLLKSKTIVKAYFAPSSGHIIVRSPIEETIKIGKIDNETWIRTIQLFSNIMFDLKEASGTYVDTHKSKHKICKFKVDNAQLSDLLTQAGESEKVEIRTGSKLSAENHKTGKVVRLPKVIVEIPTKILLSKDAQAFLSNSLQGEASEITIADDILLLVENQCNTLISGRLP